MKKQLLLFVMILLPMVAMADPVEIDGIYYNLVSKAKQAEVTSKPSGKYSGSIVIPSVVTYNGEEYSVASIGIEAFQYCSGLTSVTIPNSVTSIGEWAFFYCTSLTSVTIPNSVTSIGDAAFQDCSGLTSITIPNSVTSIGGFSFYGCSGLTSITIPNSVTSIGDYAFYGCRNLTSVTIPNSVTSIGDCAFADCTGLTSVTIPNSVTSIGGSAFYNCTSLTSITIPNSVTSIGQSAFRYCSGLTSVTIPNRVTSIGDYTFQYCSGLTSVTIPNSVTSIEWSAFGGCSGLTSVTIPNSVTSIGNYAFSGCSGLTSVTIPNSVTSIGDYAFAGCSGLLDMFCYAENMPMTGFDVFSNSNIANATLHVPTTVVAQYRQIAPWSGFLSIVALTDSDPKPGPEPDKCATPTIKVEGGKLSYSCETEGVTFKWSYIYDSENVENEGNETILSGTKTCHVSVYATKEGYADSDVATADVELNVGIQGDTNRDGKVTITDAVSVVNIILNNGEATAPVLQVEQENNEPE